jgi:hypothetical protein
MAFVNEYISKEDFAKYDLATINLKRGVAADASDDWTIDKQKNIYIRCIQMGHPETPSESRWTLFYEGKLFDFGLLHISTEGVPGGVRKGHDALRNLSIPTGWESRRKELIVVIHEALTAWKDGGMFATATDYSLTLDI